MNWKKFFPKSDRETGGLSAYHERRVINRFIAYTLSVTAFYAVLSFRNYLIGEGPNLQELLLTVPIVLMLFSAYYLIPGHKAAKNYVAILSGFTVGLSFFSFGGVTGLFTMDFLNLIIFTFLIFRFRSGLIYCLIYLLIFSFLVSLEISGNAPFLPKIRYFSPEIDAVIFVLTRLILTINMVSYIKLRHNMERRELLVKTEQVELLNLDLKSTISDLKETQKQLIVREKMASLGILSAGVAHEINNPLNYINGGLFNLRKSLQDKQEERPEQFLELIQEGVNRVSQIVKSLNQFSRSNQENHEVCDIQGILENCLVILTSQAKGRVKINRKFHRGKMFVDGNAGKLHQAFLNVISNAIQAISGEGEISIRTTIHEGKAIIEITDTGSGMDNEILAKIYDPFFTTKPPGEGTGLGLYITYSIIEEHKGEIKVSSTHGMGSTFEIGIPLLI